MQSFLAIFIMSFMWLAMPSLAGAASGEGLAPLYDWVGKYSDEPFMEGGPFHSEALQKRLRALVGPAVFQTFKGKWLKGVIFPVEERKKVLFFHYCLPHHCPESFLWLYVDPRKNLIEACYKEMDKRLILASEKTPPRYLWVAHCPEVGSYGQEEEGK